MKCLFCLKNSEKYNKKSEDFDKKNKKIISNTYTNSEKPHYKINYSISTIFTSSFFENTQENIKDEKESLQKNKNSYEKNINSFDKNINSFEKNNEKNTNSFEKNINSIEKNKNLNNNNRKSDSDNFEFPINKIFLLKNEENKKEYILTKISIQILNNLHNNSFCESPKKQCNRFPFEKRNSDKNHLNLNLPNYCKKSVLIAKHLAKKIANKNLIVLDFFTQNNIFPLEIAKNNNIVFAMSNSFLNLFNLSKKIEDFPNKNNIELINCGSNPILNIPIDIIYINPIPFFTNKIQENFSIFENFEENIINSLFSALEITENIIVQLPNFVNLNEIYIFVYKLLEKLKKKSKDRLSFEMEFVYKEQELLCVLLYFGSLRSFSKKEEIEYICNLLYEDIPNKNSFVFDQIYSFTKFIIKKISLFNTLEYFFLCEERKDPGKTKFQKFIDILHENEIIFSKDIIDTLVLNKKKSCYDIKSDESSLISHVSPLKVMRKNEFENIFERITDSSMISNSFVYSASNYSVYQECSMKTSNYDKDFTPVQFFNKNTLITIKKNSHESEKYQKKERTRYCKRKEKLSKFKKIPMFEFDD